MSSKSLSLCACIILLFMQFSPPARSEDWKKGQFELKKISDRWVFVDPSGKPFYSIAMCYAWGPDTGPYAKEKNSMKKILASLKIMKEHGFNTLNLYGMENLEEILTWCDANNFAFYPRMSYYDLPDFPKTLKEYPDFMNPEFRKNAKAYFKQYCPIFKKHPSVLAIDMDQRWMFPLDWGGEKHLGKAMLGAASIKYLPVWLKKKYGGIGALNREWNKEYRAFSDVIADEEIIKNGAVCDLGRSPWRGDIYEYTLWTVNDFLKDITSYIRKIDNKKRMVTYTTEMPEVCPFPLSTLKNSGINFVSPVHYNNLPDFGRDWISFGELLYMTKWHSDLQKMPCYISETGFRAAPLKQNPPFMAYGAGKPGDEDFVAEMYMRQTALLDSWPWMTGWTHFKFYDKLYEGDFGYIRDDRSMKPVSALGKYLNSALRVNYAREKKPKVWILYPEYAIASYYASYQQFKSLMLALEYDFLQEFDALIKDNLKYIKVPSPGIADSSLATGLLKVFDDTWFPFSFTSSVPDDDKPIIIAGRSLERLSMEDREKLKGRKVIAMTCAGIEDERFRSTDKWFLSLLDSDASKFNAEFRYADIGSYFNNDMLPDPQDGAVSVLRCVKNDAEFMFPGNKDGKNDNVAAAGQVLSVPEGKYTYAHFLLAAQGNDSVCRVSLGYSDGTLEDVYTGETVTDWRYIPFFGHGAVKTKTSSGENIYISHLKSRCNGFKTLRSITLPDNPKIHVFAVTLETGYDIVRDAKVTVSFGGLKSSGEAYWMAPLEDENFNGTALAKFDDGKPAIVFNKKNKSVVFLYDALTWRGSKDELSGDLEFTSKAIKEAIRLLNE
ncbi:MAG: hypothetical protein ABII64_08745 [Elusimicrobiota bacterium]